MRLTRSIVRTWIAASSVVALLVVGVGSGPVSATSKTKQPPDRLATLMATLRAHDGQPFSGGPAGTAAATATVRPESVSTLTDKTGDAIVPKTGQNEPRGDLVQASLEDTGSTIKVSANVAAPVDPALDVGWLGLDSVIAWPLDTNGDSVLDYVAIYSLDLNAAPALAIVDGRGRLRCEVAGLFTATDGYVSSFPLPCINNAHDPRFAAYMEYDASGEGRSSYLTDDWAPDANFVTNAFRGYVMVAADGQTETYGDARSFDDITDTDADLNYPIVGAAKTPSDRGYWMVASDGGVFAFGDAQFFGSTGAIRLNRPIVGIAGTPSGLGYWLVASDGGIFAFGDAQFFGSTGSISLNQPIVGMAATPSGQGYWLVAADGGIFAFGDAQFLGSTGAIRLNRPIVGIAGTPSGHGYWFVASDGGVFAYGDAQFFGSTGSITLNEPIVGMAATKSGNGYYFAARDGGVFSFGDGAYDGSAVYDFSAPAVAILSMTQ